MFGGGVFLKGKNSHSIVIVVPLHVSKFYRVLKKLTAYIPSCWDRSHKNLNKSCCNQEQTPKRWNVVPFFAEGHPATRIGGDSCLVSHR
jgi:hypothetical protein